MSDDRLSEMFDLVEVHGVVSGAFAVAGPWVSRGPVETPLKIIAVVRGRCRVTADDVDTPVELTDGDVAILNHRSWLELTGGDGPGPVREVEPPVGDSQLRLRERTDGADVVVGGRIDMNAAGSALLRGSLPAVGHVRGAAATATTLRAVLDRLLDEAAGDRIGSTFAIRQYGQLMVLEVLRAYAAQTRPSPGWLRLVTDERLGPALRLMHDDPGRAWRLDELARAAAMSRTSFAEHFRSAAGTPPLTYLHQWRMLLARRALRADDVHVGTLATDLGFSSGSTFSTAFKRETGESPLRYRSRARSTDDATRSTSAVASRA